MKTQSSVVDNINKQIRFYGTNPFSRPIFRVVFSDDQTEHRRGTYNEFYGEIFIRTITGVHEVKKYPYIKGRWILERWAGPELTFHPDLVKSNEGDYICVYIFQDKERNFLPPLLRVAEIIIKNLLNPLESSKITNRNLEEMAKEDKAEEEGIYNKIRERYEKTAQKAETGQVGYANVSGFVSTKDEGVKK